jgi:hypothetical protein
MVNDEKRGDRTRHIKDIFLETSRGERFLLPFKNLHGAKAMACHVNEGGDLHDDFGKQICEMVKEMSAMKHFVRSTKHRQFEDQETADMTEAAVHHYGQLKEHLKKMSNKKGYYGFKETFLPAENPLEEVDVKGLKERYVKKIYDSRFDEALPYVQRAYENYKHKLGGFGSALDEWATGVTESTWLKPDNSHKINDLRELLKQPLPVGIDGIDAKAKLEDIIGDDELNDEIEQLAQNGPDADARTLIKKWLVQNMPQLMRDLEVGKKNADDASTNWAQPVSPASALGDEYGAPHGNGDNASNMTY